MCHGCGNASWRRQWDLPVDHSEMSQENNCADINILTQLKPTNGARVQLGMRAGSGDGCLQEQCWEESWGTC